MEKRMKPFYDNPVIRETLLKTPLTPTDVVKVPEGVDLPFFKILFPEEISGNARIRFNGMRMIEWDGDRWQAYDKEGVRWYPSDLTDIDFKVLYFILADRLGTNLR